MPKNFPKAPPPVLAALLAPLAWAWGAPDLFDSYSAGVVLMQVGGRFGWAGCVGGRWGVCGRLHWVCLCPPAECCR